MGCFFYSINYTSTAYWVCSEITCEEILSLVKRLSNRFENFFLLNLLPANLNSLNLDKSILKEYHIYPITSNFTAMRAQNILREDKTAFIYLGIPAWVMIEDAYIIVTLSTFFNSIQSTVYKTPLIPAYIK